MRRQQVTEGIPLAPRVRAQHEAARQAAFQLLAHFRQALCPFTRVPMPIETREMICSNLERIVGRMPARGDLDLATHLLVSEPRSQQVSALWDMPVLGSDEVRSDDLVVVSAYLGIEVGPLEGPDADRARIRFRPVVRLLVRWCPDPRRGAAIDGADICW